MIRKLNKKWLENASSVGMSSSPPKLGRGRWSLHSYVSTEMESSVAYGFCHPDSFQTILDHLIKTNITLSDVNAFFASDDFINYVYFFPKADADAIMLKMLFGKICFQKGKPLYYADSKGSLLSRYGDLW